MRTTFLCTTLQLKWLLQCSCTFIFKLSHHNSPIKSCVLIIIMPSIRDVTFWIWYTPDIKIKQNFLQIQHTSLKNLICWKIIIEALIYRHPRWEVTWSYSVWPNSNCHFFASWCQCRCSQNKTNAVQVSAAVTGKKHYIWGPKYWQ